MVNLHITASSLFRKFQSLRTARTDTLVPCHIRDNSMFPTLLKGGIVRFDPGAPVLGGNLVAIATDEFIDIRELQVHKGSFYLIAHNRRFPTISMKDFQALYPGATFAGVVC